MVITAVDSEGRPLQTLELMKTYLVKTTEDATLREAADLMDLYLCGALPVVDPAGKLVGIITEHDLAASMLPPGVGGALTGEQRVRAEGLRVGDVMTRPVISIGEESDVVEAADLMLSRGLKRLPVTGAEGVVVGILTRIDVLQAMLEGAI